MDAGAREWVRARWLGAGWQSPWVKAENDRSNSMIVED